MDAVNVLLVDDERRNLDALEAILEPEGYNLLRAEDANTALHLLLETPDVAVILLDIRMPQMNGFELAQMIKGTKKFRQIPIVFLTAHLVDDRDIITGYGAGAVDYVTKPLKPEILKHKVAVFAELFRKTRALAELNETLEQRVRERTAELEKSEEALRQASRQKDEFLAVLAHELRNPLAPLRTGLDFLLHMAGAHEPPVARTLATMDRQVTHIVRLIDDLLDVSRITRGTLTLKKERVELGRLVESTVETFRGVFGKRSVRVDVDVQATVEAVVDATRIAQIIGNLLHNASKFTPEGGRVTVGLAFADGRALIRVTDNGVGIPADQLDRVFDMFARIEREVPGGDQGSGIGLALARGLAQMHGGDLRVESAGEGQGASFVLSVPAEAVTVAAPAPVEPVTPRAPMAALDVLVIEDNDDAADMMALWLEHMGHRVRVARSGSSGLEEVLAAPPDVVLCDVGLPGMDGIEVCEKVRAALPGGKPLMVALTGWGKAEDRQRTRAAGFDQHLVKPVSLDALTEVLRGATSAV